MTDRDRRPRNPRQRREQPEKRSTTARPQRDTEPPEDPRAAGRPSDPALFHRLARFARPYVRPLGTAVLLVLAATAAELAGPLVIKTAIDAYFVRSGGAPAPDAVPGLVRLAVFYLGLVVGGFWLTAVQTRLLLATGQRILYDIRRTIFRHLQTLSIGFFDRMPTGRIVTRVTNDVEALSEMFSTVFAVLIKDAVVLAGIAAVMLALDVRLALVAFLTLPLVALTLRIYQKIAREAFRRVRSRLARINGALAEYLSGMRVIQLFHREAAVADRFAATNRDHYDASLKELRAQSVFRPAMDVLYALGLALLLVAGARTLSGDGAAAEVGLVYAFIDYLGRLFQPIREIAENYTVVQQAMASAERIFALLDTPPEVTERPRARPLPAVRGAIRFEGVWFRYRDDRWALEDVHLAIEPGDTIGVVGMTGAGKSSLIQLLVRFYDPTRGRITLDGIDLRDLRLSDLRRAIAVVLQDPFLFDGTLLDNIRLGDPSIDEAAVRRAVEAIGLDETVRRLPEGLWTRVGERGGRLSAGERQLVAFARAFVRDPRVLILDEATAHIDSETESEVQKALRRLAQGRTTIVIAHRLATVRDADRIVVLHRGRIREIGSHRELMRQDGLYAALVRLQEASGADVLDFPDGIFRRFPIEAAGRP
ncbi:MAG: Lipid A export ATP-binding/permease protein MsbA [Hydrogenibacillus schlegelii]|uniref:Lipid A export ATP-binding/permease protein MsbA n=1 Tax=Hydrogenibacillus schlegelii TaxID=1484 RepID=A0A2T5GBM7_HYDSH|nr:ABC transporter ATP-binding protein [Hydrogenibacillus schlegelii]PTQ53590.1 MAG: Lipid A export ATP-binding/permease protein MsbA [Hydrogenibacillus schlegelii]